VSNRDVVAAKEKTLDQTVIQRLGRLLFEAERDRSTLAPLTDTFPHMTVTDAYAVQLEYARLRRAGGAILVGHKIGATSKAIQELFDINTPDYGHLFDDMRCTEDSPVAIGELIQPLVEPEIAFVLGQELHGPGITASDVIDAASGVVACLEIIDSRIEGWRIRLADTVADNGSSARFIVGAEVVPISTDLATEAVIFERSGAIVGEGTGAAVLGHPAEAAAWLANALGSFGVAMGRGSLVLSGSITSAVAARPGDTFEARFSTLGTVSCTMEGEGGVPAHE
jgi:2-keto-4-pentenoate hydratase